MTEHLYLSRATVRRDAPAAALRELLVPSEDSARVAAGHRLVWTLFSDAPDRTRDFLWREAKPGVFYFLSRRQPRDRHGLFEIEEPKIFLPTLASGDRLAFVLRANATVSRGGGPGRRGKPCDVVMDAIHQTTTADRARVRREAIEMAGLAWLEAQGCKAGFTLDAARSSGVSRTSSSHDAEPVAGAFTGEGTPVEQPVRVLGYRTFRFERPGTPVRIGVLDFEGVLVVGEPMCFLDALARGFGRAKAFGCGLMLIRRA